MTPTPIRTGSHISRTDFSARHMLAWVERTSRPPVPRRDRVRRQNPQSTGHLSMSAGPYGQGQPQPRGRGRIDHAPWRSAPARSLYQPAPTSLSPLAGTPEGILVIIAVGGLSRLG